MTTSCKLLTRQRFWENQQTQTREAITKDSWMSSATSRAKVARLVKTISSISNPSKSALRKETASAITSLNLANVSRIALWWEAVVYMSPPSAVKWESACSTRQPKVPVSSCSAAPSTSRSRKRDWRRQILWMLRSQSQSLPNRPFKAWRWTQQSWTRILRARSPSNGVYRVQSRS